MVATAVGRPLVMRIDPNSCAGHWGVRRGTKVVKIWHHHHYRPKRVLATWRVCVPGPRRGLHASATAPKGPERSAGTTVLPGVNWYSAVPRFGTYGDVATDGALADCSLSAVADVLQLQRHSGPLPAAPFVDAYLGLASADGLAAGSSVGLPVSQVLGTWASSGIDGSIETATTVGTDQASMEAALAQGPLYVALSLPAPGSGAVSVTSDVATDAWTTTAAPVGYDAPADHAAAAAGFDARYVYLVTWGYVQPVTWAFWRVHALGAWLVQP